MPFQSANRFRPRCLPSRLQSIVVSYMFCSHTAFTECRMCVTASCLGIIDYVPALTSRLYPFSFFSLGEICIIQILASVVILVALTFVPLSSRFSGSLPLCIDFFFFHLPFPDFTSFEEENRYREKSVKL